VRNSAIGSATFAGLLLGGPLAAPEEQPPPRPDWVFVAGPSFDMESGVRTMTGLGRMIFSYDDAIDAHVPLDEATPWGKALGITGRAAKLFFVDWPIVGLQGTVTHEVFGHGARAREAGLEPSYVFHLPPPYGFLSSHEGHVGYTLDARTGMLDRDITMTIGGVQSDYWSAHWLNIDMARRRGWMSYHDLLQYVDAKLTYIERFGLTLSHLPANIHNHGDPDQYLTELQERFNRWRPAERVEMAESLRLAYLYNFVDPTFWQSVYHLLFTYLYEGKRDAEIVGIELGDVAKLYPATRFNLTPFGAEHYLDLFVRYQDVTFDLYGRVGSSGLASYGGGGLRAHDIRPGLGFSFGAEIDLWSQPELLFEERYVFEHNNQLGFGAALHVDWHAYGPVHAVGKVAGKSQGHLMGQPLEGGAYGYAGIALGPGSERAAFGP
jgi:hypothetical protein